MTTIAVIGLGYVGLPLAVEFGKKFKTLGFDLSEDKVASYARHVDPTGEVSGEDLRAALHLQCSTDPSCLRDADFIIVAVPTSNTCTTCGGLPARVAATVAAMDSG